LSSKSTFSGDKNKVYLIPFGGLGQFGANMMGLYTKGKLFVLDCGVSFPDARKLGVDAIIPDCMSFIESLGGIEAYIITHGHEDHIGAIPLFFRYFQAPIYATAWTKELIEKKFSRFGFDSTPLITEVKYGQTVKHDPIDMRWIYVTHSIPEASALFIKTPNFNLFHSGDFKLDPEPVVGPVTDFDGLKEVGAEGVDIMLCDSTNANKPSRTGTEASIRDPLAKILEGTSHKVFITCFSSNVARMQTAINACAIAGRKLCLIGNSLVTTLSQAMSHGLIKDTENVLCEIDEAKYLEKNKVCFLLTGSQGEYRGALARLVYGEMRDVYLDKDDLIIFSSRIIPGNEKTVLNLMNEIEKIGAHSMTNRSHPDIHVSGHAHSEEIKDLIEILKPKKFIPVHGTFLHMNSNLRLGANTSAEVLDGFVENGEIISFDKKLNYEREHLVEFERVFVDAYSKSLMSQQTLRERLRVGEHGMVIVSGSLSRTKGWLDEPEVTFMGLGETMYYSIEDIRDQVLDGLYSQFKKVAKKNLENNQMREELRVVTRRVMYNVYGRKPVALVLTQLTK
jgi:ribonuclease J